MKVNENYLYKEDLAYVAGLNLPWEKLYGNSILISGATGLIGSFLVDAIMLKNDSGLNCTVYSLGRNEKRARERFGYCCQSDLFHFLTYDVNHPLTIKGIEKIGYVIHLASNTHPVAYATDPIGTITTNVIGVKNMLDFCVSYHAERFAFASSNEIYGENRGDVESFDEQKIGYIDCNKMRAGYPESKRCGEALCQAYRKQKGLDVVIPRFTRSYGPTLQENDTKALSQFLHKAISDKDIVLKSAGEQHFSYTYTADAVSGLLTVLLKGESGEAYNIADEISDIKLKDLAAIIAKICGKKVVFEIPDAVEKIGYSKAMKARLNGEKLKSLGWRMKYDIFCGIERSIQILKELQ